MNTYILEGSHLPSLQSRWGLFHSNRITANLTSVYYHSSFLLITFGLSDARTLLAIFVKWACPSYLAVTLIEHCLSHNSDTALPLTRLA